MNDLVIHGPLTTRAEALVRLAATRCLEAEPQATVLRWDVDSVVLEDDAGARILPGAVREGMVLPVEGKMVSVVHGLPIFRRRFAGVNVAWAAAGSTIPSPTIRVLDVQLVPVLPGEVANYVGSAWQGSDGRAGPGVVLFGTHEEARQVRAYVRALLDRAEEDAGEEEFSRESFPDPDRTIRGLTSGLPPDGESPWGPRLPDPEPPSHGGLRTRADRREER